MTGYLDRINEYAEQLVEEFVKYKGIDKELYELEKKEQNLKHDLNETQTSVENIDIDILKGEESISMLNKEIEIIKESVFTKACQDEAISIEKNRKSLINRIDGLYGVTPKVSENRKRSYLLKIKTKQQMVLDELSNLKESALCILDENEGEFISNPQENYGFKSSIRRNMYTNTNWGIPSDYYAIKEFKQYANSIPFNQHKDQCIAPNTQISFNPGEKKGLDDPESVHKSIFYLSNLEAIQETLNEGMKELFPLVHSFTHMDVSSSPMTHNNIVYSIVSKAKTIIDNARAVFSEISKTSVSSSIATIDFWENQNRIISIGNSLVDQLQKATRILSEPLVKSPIKQLSMENLQQIECQEFDEEQISTFEQHCQLLADSFTKCSQSQQEFLDSIKISEASIEIETFPHEEFDFSEIFELEKKIVDTQNSQLKYIQYELNIINAMPKIESPENIVLESSSHSEECQTAGSIERKAISPIKPHVFAPLVNPPEILYSICPDDPFFQSMNQSYSRFNESIENGRDPFKAKLLQCPISILEEKMSNLKKMIEIKKDEIKQQTEMKLKEEVMNLQSNLKAIQDSIDDLTKATAQKKSEKEKRKHSSEQKSQRKKHK